MSLFVYALSYLVMVLILNGSSNEMMVSYMATWGLVGTRFQV